MMEWDGDTTSSSFKQLLADICRLVKPSVDIEAEKRQQEEQQKLTLENELELYLTDTEITDAGLKHLQSMTGLRTLYLSETNTTDNGRTQLKRVRSVL